jgi:hypothetical protein
VKNTFISRGSTQLCKIETQTFQTYSIHVSQGLVDATAEHTPKPFDLES